MDDTTKPRFVMRHGVPIEVVTLPDPPGGGVRRRRREGLFVQLPWEWAERLMMTERAATWKVAVLILHRHWWRSMDGGGPVKLSNALALVTAGIGQDAKWRALRELEEMGLVEIRRQRGRAPLVTPLLLDGETLC